VFLVDRDVHRHGHPVRQQHDVDRLLQRLQLHVGLDLHRHPPDMPVSDDPVPVPGALRLHLVRLQRHLQRHPDVLPIPLHPHHLRRPARLQLELDCLSLG
jgi:hypothetical protein